MPHAIRKRKFLAALLLSCAAYPLRAEVPTEVSAPVSVVSQESISDLPAGGRKDLFFSLRRTPLEESKLPTNTTVLKEDRIEKLGFQNAGQALDYVEGVNVQKTQGLGSLHQPKIRGFTNKQMVVLIDNRRVPRDLTGNVDLSQIPVEAIDRIEVVRGAGSVLYGPEAAGGVIHIFTKQAKGHIPTAQGHAQWGSYRTEIYQAQAGARKDRYEGYLTASRSKSDNFQKNNKFDNTSFNGNLGYDGGRWGKGMIYFSHAQSQLGLSGGTTLQFIEWDGERERAPRNQFSQQQDRQDAVELEYKIPIFEQNAVTARLTSSELLRDSLTTSTGPVTTRSRVNYRSAYIQGDTFFGFTGGFEYIQEDIRSPFSALTQTNGYGIFIQQQVSVWDLSAVAGVRYDRNTEWGDTTNPRLSLVYNATPWLKLSGNIGSAFQSPTFADLTDFDANTFEVLPRLSTAAPLSTESSWHYDAGFEVRPHESVSAKVTAYRADIRDRITAGLSPDGSRFTTRNVGKAFNQGVEAEVVHEPFAWFAHYANYTYLQSEAKGDNFSPEFIEIQFVPRNRVNYGSSFFLPLGFELGQTLRYVGEQWTGNDRTGQKLPDFLLWNLQAGWKWREVRLRFGVNNVTERRYAENGGFGVIFPQPGRTYWGSVTVRFL